MPHTTKHSNPRPGFFQILPLIFAGSLILASSALADDWPQWRGPDRNGKSAETGLMPSWPQNGPPLAWKSQGLGLGYSSVAVEDSRIFTLGDLEESQYVIALDAETGKLRWKSRIGPAWGSNFAGARSTPTLDGDRVYALSTEGRLVCLQQADGKQVWQRDLPKDFGGRVMETASGNSWKFSESPLVDGDRVVVTPGVPGALLVALHKSSGEEIWRTRAPGTAAQKSDAKKPGAPTSEALVFEIESFKEYGLDGAGYSSIVVSHAAGVRQYVQFLGRGVVGVDTQTGEMLWHYGRVANTEANITTPVVDGDLVFASSGYGTGSALLDISKQEGSLKVAERYFLNADTMQNHHGGLIVHGGHVFTGTGHNKGFPLSVNLESGKVAWGPIRNKGRNSASIIYADDRLYLRYQNGLMVMVEATADGYTEHGSFEIPEVSQYSWSQPVIANGHLYLREQDNLFVYDIREPSDQLVRKRGS